MSTPAQLALSLPPQAALRPKHRRKQRAATPAEAARNEALARVEENATPGWCAVVYELAVALARRMPEFTGDTLWAEVEAAGLADATHERRAVGAVFRDLGRNRIAENTHRTQAGTRQINHGRPQTIWRSLVFEGER